MHWLWKEFNALTAEELYEAIALRERVFVVGQNCIYLDCDGMDRKAWHLLGFQEGKLVAYLRAFPPGVKFKEAAFGRVVVAPEVQGKGLGKKLTYEGLVRMRETFDTAAVRISAQAHLEKFYSEFGFKRVGNIYDEVGIPHLEMLKSV